MSHLVSRGFYVHYKGGIYFVMGVSSVPGKEDSGLVIYASVESCGDVVEDGTADWHLENEGLRHRSIAEFTEMVDWHSGFSDADALKKGIVNTGQEIPRFQRVVGWLNGRPLVTDPDGRDPAVTVFVSQVGNQSGVYEPGMGSTVMSKSPKRGPIGLKE